MLNNSEKGYVLYKPDETLKSLDVAVHSRRAKRGAGERSTSVTSNLRKLFGIFYQYLIVSFIYSLSCSQYFRSDGPHADKIVEMNNFCSGNLNGEPKWALQFEKATRDKHMKEKINFHFQSHLQKWKQRHFPFKVTLHLLLIVLVTTQVFLFAQSTSRFTKFVMGSQEAFELYFKQTKCNEELEKLYKLEDVYNQIALIVNSYYSISEQAVGSFRHYKDDNNTNTVPPSLLMKIDYYGVSCGRNESNLFPYNVKEESTFFTYLFPHKPDNTDNADFESNRDESCCYTEATASRCSLEFCDCNVEDQIKCYINGSNLNRVKGISFNFTLYTFFRDQVIEDKASVKAEFDIKIELKNDQYSGMTVELKLTSTLRRYCEVFYPKNTVLDIVILLLLILSSLTYVGSVIGTYRLAKGLKLHFLVYHRRRLRWTEISVLYNKWYIFMIFTNTILLVAVIAKIISDYTEEIIVPLVECSRILLGTGVFLLLCGIFGLLSYFESLNVLFITVRLAIPSVLRFSICVLTLFTAFVVCGTLILGPYHPKFEDFTLSLESLFCILCGDDLYTTFELVYTNTESGAIRIFSNFYLVSFIFIFIYAVLSLFIGIFNHAYESLSENWKQYSRGFLRDWAEGEQDIDPTESYPFPVPPVRNPASDNDSYQGDNMVGGDNIPTVVVTADQNELLPNHNPTKQPQSNSAAHLNVVNKTTRLRSLSSPIKVQVAQPPVASSLEVNDAIFKLRGCSMLSNNEFKDDDDGGN